MKIALLAVATVAAVVLMVSAAPPVRATAPSVKAMRLDAAGKSELMLLSGPPETVTMRSGLITLEPGKSVGRHSTNGNEEIVVVLRGKGEMRFWNGHPPVPMEGGMAVYGPPDTEHDVVNTGTEPLQYVFVVARAAK